MLSSSECQLDQSCLTLQQYFHQLWMTLKSLEICSRQERTRSTKRHFWPCEISKYDSKKNKLLVTIFVTYDSQQFLMCIGKNLIVPFHEFSMPKYSKTRHFGPIFGNEIVNWNMKSQTRHKDILARQSENTRLSTGDNKKVSCLGFHSWFYKLTPKMGQKWQCLRVLRVLPLFGAVKDHLKEEWMHLPMHI